MRSTEVETRHPKGFVDFSQPTQLRNSLRPIQHSETDAQSHGGVQDRGKTYDAAMRMRASWIDSLADGLAAKGVATMHRVVTALRRKVEQDVEDAEQD